MDEDLQNIEDLFRSSLEDNEELPPKKVWEGIDSRLDKENINAIKKKYNTLKRTVFLLLLILVGFSLYELNNHYGRNNLAVKNDGDINKKNKNNNAVKELNDRDDVNNSKTDLNDKTVIVKQATPNEMKLQTVDNSLPGTKPNLVKDPFSFNQSQILTGKSVTKVKIKNSEATMEEQVFDDNSETEVNTQLTTLPQLTPVNIEKINLQESNPVSIKKIISPSPVNKMPFTVDGSNSKTKNSINKPSRFSVSAFFSPDIASYRLRADKPGNQTDNAAKIEKGEHHEFSSTTGLLVDYRLSKHVALQTGLMFSNINLTVNPKTIYAQPDNNGNIKYRVNISSGYGYLLPSFQNAPVVGDSLYVSGATHKLRYIGIPAAVKYRIVKGKFSIEAMAGIGINFLLKGKLETEIKQGSNNEIDVLNKIEGLKSVYLNGLAGIGAAYKLTDKFSLTLMPTARFALTSINKGAVVKSYPNSFGLSVGIKVKL